MDMIHGSLGDKIIRFALPVAATGILQQLFNAADIAVIGRFVGKEAMAAVGSNNSLIGLMVTMFGGIAMGANVVIARSTGQANREGIRNAVHTSILIAFVGGMIMTIIGELIARPLLHWMGVPEEIFGEALRYIRIYFAGLPVIFLYNFESAIFRSQGDTRTPLICLTISGVLNVVMNVFFVVVLHMTVDGVALATVLANLISSGLLLVMLMRSQSAIRVQWSGFSYQPRVIGTILRIGAPAGLQGMVFSLSNLCIQSAINSLGADVIAASAAAFNVEIFAYFVLNSFGQACTTFVGQNRGAGDLERCRKATRICMGQDMIFTAVISALILLSGHALLRIFNTDPEVVRLGYTRILILISAELVNVVIEILSGAMRGHGQSLIPAIVSLAGICGVRILWVYTVFPFSRTFNTIMAAYPISWTITAVALVASYFVMMRKITPETV
ncbi:MAG: MATE family efflux transporter [Oscillospiraceae bacterium]|nr:MATE family efflux transporter [Oscillospiraceae bacterium]